MAKHKNAKHPANLTDPRDEGKKDQDKVKWKDAFCYSVLFWSSSIRGEDSFSFWAARENLGKASF